MLPCLRHLLGDLSVVTAKRIFSVAQLGQGESRPEALCESSVLSVVTVRLLEIFADRFNGRQIHIARSERDHVFV